MARLFGVPIEDIMRHAGIESYGVSERISLEGVITAGGVIVPTTHNRSISKPFLADSLKVLRFETRDTDYDCLHGWLVFYQANTKQIDPEAVGQLSVVTTSGNPSALIRVIKRGINPGRWDLYQHPTSEEPAESNVILESATPVRWIRPH